MQAIEGKTENVCGACVIHFIAREGSFFPCALTKGHSGGHRASGTCFKHGPYVGDIGAVPQCPHWPTCAGIISSSASKEERDDQSC